MKMNSIDHLTGESLAASPTIAAEALVDALDRIASGPVSEGQPVSGQEVTA